MKIDVNVAKDSVTVGIVACDTCNKTDPPTYNKAQVVFEFPKGSLAAADATAVEKTIGQVLTISDDDAQIMARQIAKRLHGEGSYSGRVKVVVLRETRSVEYAK